MLMKTLFSFIIVFILLSQPCSSWAAEKKLRIRLFSRLTLSEVSLSATQASWMGVTSRGENKKIQMEGQSFRVSLLGGKLRLLRESGSEDFRSLQVLIPAETEAKIESPEGISQRFSGALYIFPRQASLLIFQELPLETYVSSVLRSELPPDTPMEALKAQAILIRTYAAKARHAKEGFDFCDSTHCQVYRPSTKKFDAYASAVKSTRDMILTYHSRPIEALYHSSCGGHSSPNQKVFGGQALAYLQGVEDAAYCRDSPQADWESRVKLSDLEKILDQGQGPVLDIKISEAEPAGRVFRLKFLRGKQWTELNAQNFLLQWGAHYGWQILKSAFFKLERVGGEVIFSGHGLGHGVGLCQWGARGMALSGKKFDQILLHYFPGTRILRSSS